MNGAGERSIAREFLSALGDPYSYTPWRNAYALFGLIWGLPIPLFSLAMSVIADHQPVTVASMIASARHSPGQLIFFLLHPPAFLVLFGAMGTVRRQKAEQIRNLMREIQSKLEALQVAHDRLQALDRLKDEFLANVTHELKTPLASSCGYTEMVLQERLGPVTSRQRRGLTITLRNLRRLERAICSLLDLARMEADGVPLRPEPFELGDLVGEVVGVIQPVAEEKEITLQLPDPFPSIPVHADREGLRSVLTNLLDNAVKFTPAQGRVELRALPEGSAGLVVEVSDTGVGIPAEALPFVLERFRQAEGSTSRRFPGAGLGLAIVKKIVEAHGGKIQVTSERGNGTQVRFHLPRVRTTATEEEPA